MKRLTPQDWEIINRALALLEADADDNDAAIRAVRVKVWQRLDSTAA